MCNELDQEVFVSRFMALTKSRVEFADEVWGKLSEFEQTHPRLYAIEYANRFKKELDNIPVIEDTIRPDWL
jgi:hypothetical protein